MASASGGGGTSGSPLVKIEPIVVNLNDEDEVHYLKSAIELEVENGSDGTLIGERMAVVRNELILLLSSLSSEALRGEKAKVELLHKIEQRLNKVIGKELVKHVYFTELVVQ
ncbi:MAG: flagellar basal body-associated FliL family protein [Deltaproteobacteria bacterium]|nr:flagellar basal body-associated FliL family protein [Deltaproteobacteria bacterium]